MHGSNFGYAYAHDRIKHSLANFEHDGNKMMLELNSKKSKVQLFIGQPPGFFYPHQYKINIAYWESTVAPVHWKDVTAGHDEFWMGNPFGREAIINAGIPEEKAFVYENGIDVDVWTPVLRKPKDKIRFLHVDAGSPRKRSDMALSAFKKAFGDDPNYELVLKYSWGDPSPHNWHDENILRSSGEFDGNVRRIREQLSLDQLVSLYHFCDVLVFPTEGEGFGYIPLQAIATGMPTITTGRWCSYEHYLGGNVIESHLAPAQTVETYVRLGHVIHPHEDSLIFIMKEVAENIEDEYQYFYDQVPRVSEEYNWQSQTNKTINSLIDRIGVEGFGTYKGYLK